jgi:hypothetical protein
LPGSARSTRSTGSFFSLGSAWSMGAAGSAFSLGSLASVLSVGSVGSVLSIGSAGSILSIGSAGSILSIGSAGSILSVGTLGGRRRSAPTGHAGPVGVARIDLRPPEDEPPDETGHPSGRMRPRLVFLATTLVVAGALGRHRLGSPSTL